MSSFTKNGCLNKLPLHNGLVSISFSVWVLYNWYWYLIPLIPFVIYPFAWSGHYLFEDNEPAAFHNPIKAKISDWIMFKDILLGRLRIW